MRLQLSLALLQLFLFDSSNAFTQIQRPSFSVPSTTSKLNAFPTGASTLLTAVEPEDPYAKLLEAYAKKGSPVLEAASSPAASVAASTPAAPVVDTAVQATQAADVTSQTADAATQAFTDAAAQASSASDAAIKAMSDAASQAAAAAAKAAAAASAIGASSTTAKTGAAAATAVKAGTAPTLVQYFTTGAYRTPGTGPSNWETTKQGFNKLNENLSVQLGDANKVISQGTTKAEKIVGPAIKATSEQVGTVKASATAAAGAVGAGSASVDLQALMDQLHLQEYGGWYVAAIAVLVAAGQRQAGMDAAKVKYEAELALAKSRADEAAEAASVAAEGAQFAKELATKIQTAGEVKGSVGDTMLERTKIQEMMVEKEMMREEVNRLTDETVRMRKQLEKLLADKEGPTSPTITATTTSAPPKATKTTIERDPDEDARIISVLKEIDETNKAAAAIDVAAAVEVAAAAEAADMLADEAEFVARAAAATVSEMESIEEAAAETWDSEEEIRAIAEAAAEKKAAEEAAKQAAEEAAKKVTAKAKPRTKKATIKVTKTKKKAVKVKRKTATATKKAAVVSSDDANPWASLTESTLKRKTVAQLTEYLSERGVTVIDESSGKPLKKAILVESVQAL